MKKFLVVNEQVLPITTDKASIKAILNDWTVIETQDKISNVVDYDASIKKIEFLDNNIFPSITKNIKETIKNADYIIIWPWDLFTSIIANFIVKGLTEEIEKSDAKIIYILNANNKKWETTNYNIDDFVNVVNKYLWKKSIDYLVWNNKIPDLTEEQKIDFKNNISVKWWDYLLLNDKYKINNKNLKVIKWEYINSKDLFRYNEKLIEDLLELLK
jgi:uncharacterized cofD-like protein